MRYRSKLLTNQEKLVKLSKRQQLIVDITFGLGVTIVVVCVVIGYLFGGR